MDAVEVRTYEQILEHVWGEITEFQKYRRVPTLILANADVIEELQRALNKVPDSPKLIAACLKEPPDTCSKCPVRFRFKLYGLPVIEVESAIPAEVR